MDLLVVVSIVLLLVMMTLSWLIIRRSSEPDPFSVKVHDFSMTAAWDRARVKTEDQPEDQAADSLGETTREAVFKDLLEFERQLQQESAAGALTALRRELMDSVDRRILNEEILALPPERRNLLRSASSEILQTDNQARRYIHANEFRLAVLREYAGGRFGDKAANDWFAVYEKAAGMRRRSLAHFLVRSATGDLQEAEDARQQAISMVDSQLRSRLLQVAPGTTFRKLEGSGPENPGQEEAGNEESDRETAGEQEPANGEKPGASGRK